ncbi:MAG: hypothetical protein F6K54_05950 [Okeania sp. SIO3B5]|uniref:hypothetical protein n=1 Tax=Okeania sp. SIO3B5 TaxID=2607811 RepID=UPI0013FF94D8|nr:hypothetical protein [Okeania sp. SIO3B5]NEO52657.1 hypothetical protein [Okeania sp. SIO3B5]
MSSNLLWIFVKIVLPLMPIVINFIFIKIMGSDKKWYQILTGGELFIFSTTISASAIGVTFFQGSLDNSLGNLIFCILLLTLIFSTSLFGFGRFIKLDENKIGNIENEELYAISSIACAIAAIFCSYYINFLSGTIK